MNRTNCVEISKVSFEHSRTSDPINVDASVNSINLTALFASFAISSFSIVFSSPFVPYTRKYAIF
jgi:hypothetical protein